MQIESVLGLFNKLDSSACPCLLNSPLTTIRKVCLYWIFYYMYVLIINWKIITLSLY